MAQKKEFQSLIIPQIVWNKETLSSTYGELVAQPLEAGFGFTLGGALRRILLGGVEGSAVTAIIIKGVNNEFSALPGVVEDCMQLILNCKELIIKNETGAPGKMKLQFKDEGTATAGDIKPDAHLTVLNKEHVLAHVAKGGNLDIEFFVESGRGYQAAKWPIGQALQEDGKIYVDAMFTPVRRVTFFVEKTRVGRDIDYDKLNLIISTDGTQSPSEVLHYAVSVLRSQLENFLEIPEIPFNEISKLSGEKEPQKAESKISYTVAELLMKPIDVLEFSVRAHNCLINADIKRILDLVNLREEEVLKIKNFGRKSFDEVRDNMKTFGLSFGMNITEDEVKAVLAKEQPKA